MRAKEALISQKIEDSFFSEKSSSSDGRGADDEDDFEKENPKDLPPKLSHVKRDSKNKGKESSHGSGSLTGNTSGKGSFFNKDPGSKSSKQSRRLRNNYMDNT